MGHDPQPVAAAERRPDVADGMRFALLGDQPERRPGDHLEFDRLGASLADMVLASRDATPFALGIEGGWGVGKSSLMSHICERLQAGDARTVWFNAWRADEGRALESLAKTVLNSIDEGPLRRAARKRRAVKGLRLTTKALAELAQATTLVDAIWDNVTADPLMRGELRPLIEEALQRTAGSRDGERSMLAVFVDDLDRCSAVNVFQVLEGIKLYLNAPGIVFVIGYDRGVVSNAVLSQAQFGGSSDSGDYLEKVIQVDFRMPAPRDDCAEALLDSYLETSRTSDLFDASARSLILERSARNPRRLKRFINRFVLEYGLDDEWAEIGADVLGRVLLLYMYSPLRDLLRVPSPDARDPITLFLDYVLVRQTLAEQPAAGDAAWERVKALFWAYGVYVDTDGSIDAAALLRRLEEKHLPPGFADWAQDRAFCALIRELGDPAQRQRLVRKLERGRSWRGEDRAGRHGDRAARRHGGTFPYRLGLDGVLTAERVAEISSAGRLTFHTTGNTGSRRDRGPQRAVAHQMGEDLRGPGAPAFLFLLGDVVYDGDLEDEYREQFYEPYSDYGAPIFAVPGNHDVDSSGGTLTAFAANFCAASGTSPSAPGTGRRPMVQPHLHWTLRSPLLSIIGMFSGIPDGGAVYGDQVTWLAEEIAAAPRNAALVVAMHHPAYSFGEHRAGSPHMRKVLDGAVRRAGRVPDLLLASHTLSYQRFARTSGRRAIPYLVLGAGGFPQLDPIFESHDDARELQAEHVRLEGRCDSRHGYARITVTRAELHGEYVAVEPDGSGGVLSSEVVDSFTVPLRGEPAMADAPAPSR